MALDDLPGDGEPEAGAAGNADDDATGSSVSTDDDDGDDDGPDDNDVPITGPDLERAKEAALAHLGEGEVTDTEIEDEESYYEVEVTLPDDGQVDVQLDESFNVVDAEAD